jgi:AraC family transcriptional regulator
MSEIQPIIVDFTKDDDVLQILPRSPQRSSEGLGWSEYIQVQQHQQPAWETPDYTHTKHMLLIHDPDRTNQSYKPKQIKKERWFDGRRQQDRYGNGNNIVILPATVQHRANWSEECSFSLIFLEPDGLIQVARESVTVDRVNLRPHHAIRDPSIAQIGQLLTAELESNRVGSRLFVDSLTIALSIHLLRHYSDWQQPFREDDGGLPWSKLQQAIAYIHDHLTEDLTISAIANELGMSQYYFSRLFRQSLGIPPYQYVMEKRIERAQDLLKMTSLSVAQIAKQVGFSSQNQLTVQFRQFTGTTPSNYRKQL